MRRYIQKYQIASFALIIAFIILFTIYFPAETYKSDTLWHIRAGEAMIDKRTILKDDPFSWSANGAKWTAHSWLYEVIIAAIYRNFGFRGLWAITVIFSIIYGLPLFYMTREKPVGWLAVSFLLVTVIGVEWCIRPHTAMLAIFSVFVLTLVEGMLAKGSPLIYLMTFPLFLIWANIHSSVTAGLITLVIFIIYGMADVNLLIPALGGTLVNPQWIEIFAYSWRASSNPKITSAITEWFSPDFHLPWAMAAMILTLTVMLFIKPHWRKLTIKSVEISLPPVGITLILIGMFLYLKSVRHIAVLTIMIAAAIRVSDFGVPIRIKNQKKEREIEKIQLAIAMGLFMGTIILAAGNYGFHPLTVNIETALANDPMNSAVEFMKATGRTERILNDYDIGDYLIWHGLKPFIDGRADMYVFNKPEVWDDYIKSIFFEFEKPEAILDKYKIKHIVFRKDLPYAKYLRNIPGVKMVYENDEVVVFDCQRGKEF